jgi:hypothetical protein
LRKSGLIDKAIDLSVFHMGARMGQVWARRVNGKLVVAPGGAIQGSDFQTTARSSDPPFPNVGEAVGYKSLGITGREKWSAYCEDWPQGGLYLRPVTAPDGIYLVASRIRPYLETPNDPTSRFFVETAHAAHPVETADFQSLFQLPQHLRTDPLTNLDFNFPPLLLSPSEGQLPEGWFEKSRLTLNATACGGSTIVRDHSITVEQFFERSLWVLACLPTALRWRVSIVSGVYSLSELRLDPAQCVLALTYLGSRSDSAKVDPTGDAYVRWLESATNHGRNCRRIEDVLNIVEAKFPSLCSWDAIPPAHSFRQAVHSLAEVTKVEALNNWVLQRRESPSSNSDHAVPVLEGVIHLKLDVLRALSDGWESTAIPLGAYIAEVTGPDWHPAWHQLVAETTALSKQTIAIGNLFGAIAPFDPRAIASELPRIELPMALYSIVVERVTTAFREALTSETVVPWAGLLESAFLERRPGWFERWVGENHFRILWTAVRLQLNEGTGVTTSWNNSTATTAARALSALLEGRHFDMADLWEFCEHVKFSDQTVALNLTTRLEHSVPELSLRIALAASLQPWLQKALDPERFASTPEGWIRAIASIGRSKPNLDRRVIECLLVVWDRLQPDEKLDLRVPLKSTLGPLDSLLFENKINAIADGADDWVWNRVLQLGLGDSAFGTQLLRAASENPEFVDNKFQTRLIGPLLKQADIASIAPGESKSLQFALSLRSNKATRLEELSDKELQAAEMWLPLVRGLPNDSGNRNLALTTLDQFPTAVRFRTVLSPFPPKANDDFWSEWVKIANADLEDRKRYCSYVKEAGLDGTVLWRLIMGWHAVDELFGEEIRILGLRGVMPSFVDAVLRGSVRQTTMECILQDAGSSNQLLDHVCESIEKCHHFFSVHGDKLTQRNKLALFQRILRHASEKSINQIYSCVRPGIVRTIISPVRIKLLNRKTPRSVFRLAVELFRRSDGPTQREMIMELTNRHHELVKNPARTNPDRSE